MTQVVIVGAGPAGTALALLLAKRGIPVKLIEAAKDFQRVFRGEALMPSGLDALEQMGLSALLKQIPHRPINAWEFILGNQLLFRVEEPMGADRPCTLVSQPPFLEALMAEAQLHSEFELIQGTPVKELLWQGDRVAGVKLADGQEISAELVIGTDGRNSVIRKQAGLELVKQPKSIDVLWFKLPTHPQFVADNVFCSILNGNQGFSIFHGAEAGKLHLAWILSPDADLDRSHTNWAETFAALSPVWLAKHFRQCAAAIEAPIRLSVVVGRCPRWYQPGVLLLGDAAHPMSPVRAQGINLALRDVMVAANHLVPLLSALPSAEEENDAAIERDRVTIDQALSRIQAEREPEIIRAQYLQMLEANQGEQLRKNKLKRSLIVQLSPLLRPLLQKIWTRRQVELRQGVTQVKLLV